MARVLLAEDDDNLRPYLSRFLEMKGHEVVAFADGADALPALGVVKFDILVTDVCMPVMDGFELARRAAAADPDLKVIFITGFSAMAMQMSGGRVPDIEMLSKPFHLSRLTEAVDRIMAEREAAAKS